MQKEKEKQHEEGITIKKQKRQLEEKRKQRG